MTGALYTGDGDTVGIVLGITVGCDGSCDGVAVGYTEGAAVLGLTVVGRAVGL